MALLAAHYPRPASEMRLGSQLDGSKSVAAARMNEVVQWHSSNMNRSQHGLHSCHGKICIYHRR
jgi:hypothetical protein